MLTTFALASSLLGLSRAQQVGTYQTETHPAMTWQRCSEEGSCTTVNGKVVIDANWRWVHDTKSYTNCYSGNEWNKTICANNQQCAQNCALDGAEYAGTYGVTTSGDALSLKFVQPNQSGKNIGSRLYMMEDDSRYQMYNLLGNEFTFDVDTSKLPCGLNGALYFVSMDADGGMAKYPANKAGAKYGTGYCDTQCPRDLKFINGEANSEGWSGSDANSGAGNFGSCCAEMDVWEANSFSTALTPHSCDQPGQVRCSGNTCGGTYSGDRYAGVCDPDGCDFNPYRMGNPDFYGQGKRVDTSQKVTVVTQFLESEGTLSEIKRLYVQNGRVIANSQSLVSSAPGNSITPEFCAAQKTAFGDRDVFNEHGGMRAMGDAFQQGMVLVMSLWDDHYANMLWLDSNFPTDVDPTRPGVARGSCATTSGKPEEIETQFTNAAVTYSNIKFGPIGSTFQQPHAAC